jgi:hypothetical protein
MIAFIINDLLNYASWWEQPWLLVLLGLRIWMLVDAIRREEWFWAVLIFCFGFSAIFYYFLVYRNSPTASRGFELPGAGSRRRIKELEGQIHHLDKAHHHFQLGDVYFGMGKFAKAEACYRAALEREADDIDTRAHLGQCLLRQGRAAEARPWLEQVCQEDHRHDHGHSLMGLAETQAALQETDLAIVTWRRVLADHAYARARVQLAELLAAKNEHDAAIAEAREVLSDDAHAPTFQRKRDKVWIKRAKKLLKQLGA